MPRRVAIVQSSYIPWKGYFDLIASVDEFILLDDVQYTRRDWRNRNRIKTPGGLQWLTIPVAVKGRFTQRICDTEVSDRRWSERHWRTIRAFYSRAAGFADLSARLERLYSGCRETLLSRINYRFLRAICDELGIRTRLSWSMDYRAEGSKGDRLLALCRQAGATEYVSGPAARAYLNETAFEQAGIAVSWFDYSGYPEYRQLFPPFEHSVSIVDLLLNEGPSARTFMKCARRDAGEG